MTFETEFARELELAKDITKQAGGRVTTIGGQSLDYRQGFNSAIVSNGVVHDKLVGLAVQYTE